MLLDSCLPTGQAGLLRNDEEKIPLAPFVKGGKCKPHPTLSFRRRGNINLLPKPYQHVRIIL